MIEYIANLKKPQIEEKNDFVEVKFYRPKHKKMNNIVADSSGIVADNSEIVADNSEIVADNSEIVADSSGKVGLLTKKEEMILTELKERKRIKSGEVEQILDLKPARVRQILSQMIEKDLIIRKGQGRSTYYVLP